jgi:hypothetical protein
MKAVEVAEEDKMGEVALEEDTQGMVALVELEVEEESVAVPENTLELLGQCVHN